MNEKIIYFMGKDINEMTKEELLYALRTSLEQIEMVNGHYEQVLDIVLD
jgi:hypothetical protein